MNKEQLKLFEKVYTHKGQLWGIGKKRWKILIELNGRMEIWEIRFNGQQIGKNNEVQFNDTDFIRKVQTISNCNQGFDSTYQHLVSRDETLKSLRTLKLGALLLMVSVITAVGEAIKWAYSKQFSGDRISTSLVYQFKKGGKNDTKRED